MSATRIAEQQLAPDSILPAIGNPDVVKGRSVVSLYWG